MTVMLTVLLLSLCLDSHQYTPVSDGLATFSSHPEEVGTPQSEPHWDRNQSKLGNKSGLKRRQAGPVQTAARPGGGGHRGRIQARVPVPGRMQNPAWIRPRGLDLTSSDQEVQAETLQKSQDVLG